MSSHSSHKVGDVVEHVPPTPHESPLVMTAPLMILAFFAIALGFVGTPAER